MSLPMRYKPGYALLSVTSRILSRAYTVSVEGALAPGGPQLLLLPHQSSVDHAILMKALQGQNLAFVYNRDFRTMGLFAPFLRQAGQIELSVRRGYFRRDGFFRHLRDEVPVVGFPQGEVEGHEIKHVYPRLVRTAMEFESETGENISIVPVGVDFPTKKFRQPSLLLEIIGGTMYFPERQDVTVRFGTPHLLSEAPAKELTHIVMREVAEMSGIPYRVR
jgi:1-acyl-sn-glycerol-3-phosphate acyltransferase